MTRLGCRSGVEDILELLQIDDHSGDGIGLAAHGHLEPVVVAVLRCLPTKETTILLGREIAARIPKRGGEIDRPRCPNQR